MILKLRQRMAQEESGFTLVELLVVMLILGLLAAIAIPAFFNQQNKAKDADAKSFARTAETAMETYATDNAGQYHSDTVAAGDLANIEATLNGADNLQIAPATGAGDTAANSYTVSVDSSAGETFSITRHHDGTTVLSCTPANTNGCPASTPATAPDGDWGAG